MLIKQLSKIKLHEAVELGDHEMKMIYGGSINATYCCAYNTDGGSSFTCLPNGGPDEAAFMAGTSGWWACNTSEVKLVCGC